MSYLLDKQLKRQKYLKIFLGLLILFFLIFFRTSIFNGLSYLAHGIFRPIAIGGNAIGKGIRNTSAIFHTRKTLQTENDQLRANLSEQENRIANYNSLLAENNQLKEILGRKPEAMKIILAGILSKPNHSPYDTLIIDVGTNQGIIASQRVFALGNIPIGYVAETYANSSKIILYSSPGEKIEVVITGQPARNADSIATAGGDAFMQVIGRGGGNFEMILPRDFVIENGAEVNLPGITSYLLAKVATIISDPRDSFQKALLVSPVNIQELKFVEVEK